MDKRRILDILYGNKVEEMREYLDSGGNPDFSINNEETPLGIANTAEMAQLLLDKGANIHIIGHNGFTPLLWQANSSRPTVIKVLLDSDPTLINDRSFDNENALHLCVRHAYETSLQCAEILLAHTPKIDINLKDKNGFTPLNIAIRSSNVASERIIVLLIDAGADITIHPSLKNNPKAIFATKYAASKKIGKFILNRKSIHNTLRNAWRPPNQNNETNMGGNAYQALLQKVKNNGHFSFKGGAGSKRKHRRTIRKVARNRTYTKRK
jgi:ankyrin repeat protein